MATRPLDHASASLSSARALVVLALLVPTLPDSAPGAPQEPTENRQAQFANRVFRDLQNRDQKALEQSVRSSPYLVEVVLHKLLDQSSEQKSSQVLDAARRLAEMSHFALGRKAEIDAVRRFEALGPKERKRRLVQEGLFQEAIAEAAHDRIDEAESLADRCLEIARELKEPFLEARAIRLRGQIRKDLDRFEEARSDLVHAEKLDRDRDARRDLLATLLQLSELELRDGKLAEALRCTDDALVLSKEINDLPRRAELLYQRGYLLDQVGESTRAEQALDRARDLSRTHVNRALERKILLAQASLSTNRARYAEAVKQLLEIAKDCRTDGDGLNEAECLLRLGGVYSEMGLATESENAFDRARQRIPADGPQAEVSLMRARCLVGLGITRLDSGRPDQALTKLALGRAQFELGGDSGGSAKTLRYEGAAWIALGRIRDAEAAFRESLQAPRKPRDGADRALAWIGLGESLERQERWDAAQDAFENALEQEPSPVNPEIVWRVEFGLGRIREAKHDLEKALSHYRLAFERLEGIREQLTAPSFRRTYLGDKQALYRRGARLLARRGRDEESFAWAEKAKARTLLELRQAPATTTRVSPLGETEESAQLEADLALLQRAVQEGVVDADRDLESKLRNARGRHAEFRLAKELSEHEANQPKRTFTPRTLREISSALPRHTVLLEYLVGEEGASAWVIQPSSSRFVELPTNSTEIEALVDRIHRPIEALRSGRVDLANLRFDAKAARTLYRRLIAPIEPLVSVCNTLYVVPDGALRRLPFSLLVREIDRRPVDPHVLYTQYLGCRFLIEDVAIGTLPAASALLPSSDRHEGSDTSQFEPSMNSTSLLSFSDPRPLPEGAALLRSARSEVKSYGEEGSFRILSGKVATESAFKRLAPSAQILHIAAHGILRPHSPSYSRLTLAPGDGQDGWVHAYEVEQMRLSNRLVILSACEAAGTAGRAEGLAGLSTSFLQAGSRAVIASIWIADDGATADLVGRLVREIHTGRSSVDALRAAQIDLLRNGRRGNLLYVHPFFWAGFLHLSSG